MIARSLSGWRAPGTAVCRRVRGSCWHVRIQPTVIPGVAADLGLPAETVRKWRSRFTERGAAGLRDAPRPGRRKAALVLANAERERLERWARQGKTSQALALRAKIMLACPTGGDNRAVAAEFGVGEHMVARSTRSNVGSAT